MKASTIPLVRVLALLILVDGCTPEPMQPRPADAGPNVGALDNTKSQPHSANWAGRALPFVDNLHVHDMAATPTRLLATTLGHEEKLVRLDELGTVGTFTLVFTAAPEAECYVAISPGWSVEFPVDEVWVTRGNELLRLSPLGDRITSITMLPVGQGDIAGLCFDTIGTFNHALLLLSEAGGIYSLASETAPLALLGTMAPGGCAPNVATHGFGTHGGNLLVSYPEEDVVRGMDADGHVSYVVGWSGVTSALAVPAIVREFGRSRGAFFVALGDGRVLRFEKDDIGSLENEMLVTSRHRSGSGVVTPQGVGYSTRAFSRFWGPEACTTIVQRPAVTRIDVLPQNGAPNPSFVQGSQQLITVTLLSSPWFWPNLVDFDNVTLADAEPVPFGKGGIGNWVDLNDDGTDDLTLFFRPSDMQVPTGIVSLPLWGQTMAEEVFEGAATFTVLAP